MTDARAPRPSRLLRLTSRWLMQPAARRYLRRERTYRGHGLVLRVPPGVFHPGLFFASGVMARWLAAQPEPGAVQRGTPLRGARLVDVGTGSGLLGLVAARHGAEVTLLDLSPRALVTAAANAQRNGLRVRLAHSDGLRDLPAGARYDWIIANPPWFSAEAPDEAGLAWYAGPQLAWFSGFFTQLAARLAAGGRAVMVLGGSADLGAIEAVAAAHGWRLAVVHEERVLWELQTIVQVVPA